MAEWCRAQPLAGMQVEVRRLPGKTPLLLVDVPGELPGCVLLYGHLDKQPEFTGWLPGLGPWEPVIRDGKLYGRGAADDGYAVFSSLTAIAALKEQQVRLPRCVVLIEACEESGSVDLPASPGGAGRRARRTLAGRVPGCGMRQLRAGVVHDVAARQPRRHAARARAHRGCALRHGHRHRPDPFRILEQLLARIENPVTGDLLLDELHVNMPRDRRAQAAAAAQVLGSSVAGKLPWARGRAAGLQRPDRAPHQQHLARHARRHRRGRPAGGRVGGQRAAAGSSPCKLSLRLPPTCDADARHRRGARGARARSAVRGTGELR